MIVAIDGPAGSGKSTMARMLAQRLGFEYLDTGAMYRSVALMAQRHGVALDDVEGLARLAGEMDILFVDDEQGQRVFVDGEDVTMDIRTPQVDAAVSPVSAIPQVREKMVIKQRQKAELGDVVAEGRDTTTVVFPEADVKIYLTASAQVRAERRVLQNIERGLGSDPEAVDVDLVRRQIEARDLADSTREVSPLRPAEGAHIIDSSDMTGDEVFEIMRGLVESARRAGEN